MPRMPPSAAASDAVFVPTMRKVPTQPAFRSTAWHPAASVPDWQWTGARWAVAAGQMKQTAQASCTTACAGSWPTCGPGLHGSQLRFTAPASLASSEKRWNTAGANSKVDTEPLAVHLMNNADTWSAIRLHHLRDLLAVVETGSLRAAARKLGLTQPSLTKSLRQLEEQTALVLLVRSSHGVTLTNEGQRVVARARDRVGAPAHGRRPRTVAGRRCAVGVDWCINGCATRVCRTCRRLGSPPGAEPASADFRRCAGQDHCRCAAGRGRLRDHSGGSTRCTHRFAVTTAVSYPRCGRWPCWPPTRSRAKSCPTGCLSLDHPAPQRRTRWHGRASRRQQSPAKV